LRSPRPGQGEQQRAAATVLISDRRLQLGVVGLTALAAGMSLYLFSAALPLYLFRNRGYSLGLVGALVGLASVVQLIATLVAGPLVDRRGARLAMRLAGSPASLFLTALATAGLAIATSLLQKVGGRAAEPGGCSSTGRHGRRCTPSPFFPWSTGVWLRHFYRLRFHRARSRMLAGS